MNFDEAARTLYVVRPQDFVARRNALVADALRDGDKSTAAGLKQLRRPTIGAWLANLLANERPSEIDALLALGEQLRDAQRDLSGPELRRLARQRHEVIRALVSEARLLAREAGQQINEQSADELEQTLSAALADVDAANALRSGRLTSTLRHTGFGVLQPAASETTRARASAADEPPPTRVSPPGADRHRERVAAVERLVEEAHAELSTAAAAVEQTSTEEADLLDLQRQRLDALRALERQLELAKESAASVGRQLEDARLTHQAAQRALRDAKRRAADAESRLERARRER